MACSMTSWPRIDDVPITSNTDYCNKDKIIIMQSHNSRNINYYEGKWY